MSNERLEKSEMMQGASPALKMENVAARLGRPALQNLAMAFSVAPERAAKLPEVVKKVAYSIGALLAPVQA